MPTAPQVHVSQQPTTASATSSGASSGGLAAELARNWLERPFYYFYERRLAGLAATWTRPRHIGIILDGNRRFARSRRLSSVIDGHALGAEKLREVLNWCHEFEIKVVTIWIFSLENFSRDTEEVTDLLNLIEQKTRELVASPDVHDNKVQVRYIGRTELLPPSLQEAMKAASDATAHYDRFILNVAIAYGGRDEITEACRQYLSEQAAAGRDLNDVAAELTPEVLDRYVSTAGQPDPDLIIRTSGEVRLSGFLLWQSAYAEFYFCDTNWPAFRKIDFLRALRDYHHRQRRYGK
jgi:short-chain Z-isoprenyl diphosphate synthase